MSFLGYIGKSLGQGSAPIARGAQTAAEVQAFDEFKRDRANREEARSLEMAGLRRTERTEAADEAEINRAAGLAARPVPPVKAGNGLGLEDIPYDPDERITVPRVPGTAPAGLNATGAPAASAVTAGVTEVPIESVVGKDRTGFFGGIEGLRQETPVAPRQNDPVLISARLKEIEKALAATNVGGRTRNEKILEERRKLQAERDSLRGSLENVIAQDPEIVALNAQLEKLGTSRGVVSQRQTLTAKRDALAKRLSGMSAAELQQRGGGITPAAVTAVPAAAAPAASTPAPAPTAAGATAAAVPAVSQPATAAAASVEIPPALANRPISQINPEQDLEINRQNPNLVPYDIERVQSRVNILMRQHAEVFDFINRRDITQVAAARNTMYALEEEIIEYDAVLAKLQITQAVGLAQGGSPEKLNRALVEALGYDIQVSDPSMDEEGNAIFQITRAGIPDPKPVTATQLSRSIMRLVDVQHDLEMTKQESEQAANVQALIMKYALEGQLIEMKLNADLNQQLQQARLNAELEIIKKDGSSNKVQLIGEIERDGQPGYLLKDLDNGGYIFAGNMPNPLGGKRATPITGYTPIEDMTNLLAEED